MPSPPQRAIRSESSVRQSNVSVWTTTIAASCERQLGTRICMIAVSRRTKLSSNAGGLWAAPFFASLCLGVDGGFSLVCSARLRTCRAFAAMPVTVAPMSTRDGPSKVSTSSSMRPLSEASATTSIWCMLKLMAGRHT